LAIGARAAQAKVNRDIVLDLPDCPDEGGAGSKQADIALIKGFGDRSHWPVMRTLDNRVEKVIHMLLAGELNLSIEVGRSPVPALRDDAGENCPGPMFVIDPRQQDAEFGCDTRSGFLLQAALAQNHFQKGLACNHARPRDAGRQTMSDVALE
jgi:hypothetical protein